MKRSAARKWITALLTVVFMIIGAVPAFALPSQKEDGTYLGWWPYAGFVPYSTYTPYDGVDFSKEAVYKRMISLQTNFPTGTGWSMNISDAKSAVGPDRRGSCNTFVMMVADVAFGTKVVGISERRDSYDWDNLRVGDIIDYNNNSIGHLVIVLDVNKTTGVVTVAEGAYNSKVYWGRQQLSIEGLKKTSGYGSGNAIVTWYNPDGSDIRHTKLGIRHIRYDGTWSDTGERAVPGTDDPVSTTPTPTPTPSRPTPTPTPTPAPTPARPPVAGIPTTIIVENMSDESQRIYRIDNKGVVTQSITSYSTSGSTTVSGLKVVTTKDSGDLTITYNNVTYIVKPMEVLEIDTANPGAAPGGAPAATPVPTATPAPTTTPAPTATPAPTTAIDGPCYSIANKSTDKRAIFTITPHNIAGEAHTINVVRKPEPSVKTYRDFSFTYALDSSDITVVYKGQTYILRAGETIVVSE